MTNTRHVKDTPWWEVSVKNIGREERPFVIIENFFPNPEILTQDARRKTFTANAPYYPGVRAAVPGAYFRPIMKGLSDILVNIFGYGTGVDMQECHYSLVTTQGPNLNTVQRLPHIDGGHDGKVALLHYLCDKDHGGTGFYRQCRTGFETVPNVKFPEYKRAVEQDHKAYGPPDAAYFSGSSDRFEEIAKIDANFNRAVLYFGVNLHSVLPGKKSLTSDPQTGRLTVNSFFSPL